MLVLLSLVALSWAAAPSLTADPQVPNLDKALEAQRHRVAGSPSAAAYNDLGNLLVLADRLDEAETAYLRAVELAPAETAAHFNLGVLYQQLGRGRDAQSQFQKVLEVDPGDAWAQYQLGVLLADRKDRKSALEHYARALALDPSLSFAENNPHIIDNKLFSEALLMSQRYSRAPGSGVARQYGEPERIRDLLLGKKTGEGTPQGAAAAETGETDDAAARLPQARPDEAPPGTPAAASGEGPAKDGAPGAGVRAPQTVLVAPSASAPGTTRSPSAAAAPRVTTPAVPAPGNDNGRPGRPAISRPAPRRNPDGSLAQPGSSSARPPAAAPIGGASFRPSRRSTAQLELRLEVMGG